MYPHDDHDHYTLTERAECEAHRLRIHQTQVWVMGFICLVVAAVLVLR